MTRNLLAILSALVVATAAAPSMAQQKKMLAFVTNGASDFWTIAQRGTEQAAKELPGYRIEFRHPQDSTAADQRRVLDDLVAAGVAGISVSPVNPGAATDTLNRVAGQTVMFTNDSDAPASNRLLYIGTNNVDAGKDAGQLMKKALPNGGKCMMFVGSMNNANARERVEGIKSVIAGTRIEIVDIRTDEIDFARSKRNVEDTLAAYPNIDCLVGLYAYNPPHIYEAAKAAGKLGQVKIIAFDENPVTLRGVKEGSIVGTVVQQPYEFGYQSMKLLARYIEGDKSFIPADKQLIVPTQVVDQSNVDAFITKMRNLLGK